MHFNFMHACITALWEGKTEKQDTMIYPDHEALECVLSPCTVLLKVYDSVKVCVSLASLGQQTCATDCANSMLVKNLVRMRKLTRPRPPTTVFFTMFFPSPYPRLQHCMCLTKDITACCELTLRDLLL